jgi:hypothetical protein
VPKTRTKSEVTNDSQLAQVCIADIRVTW